MRCGVRATPLPPLAQIHDSCRRVPNDDDRFAAVEGSARAETPAEEIVCVDCGGPAHLLTPPPEDGIWLAGDVVAYRCRDCRDRWDIELVER
ncbi:MAG: hypothetical protein RLZZ518_1103 [Actinomycetota bacterium]